ncbi:MAG: substrate-binding domain-containing protein [Paludibacteraceae bacterium]|nr:substrate-binding domain-containing protein [Paludibacteraceae bacterium]
MKKQFIFIIFSILPILACRGQEALGTDPDLNITISNFPVLDGSESTSPLRLILMSRLLGFNYEWQHSQFIQRQEDAPKQVVPDYTCDEETRRDLLLNRLLNNNTHGSFVNLIDDKVDIIITARSISRDEKAYAEEQGVTLLEKPIARDALTFMVNAENPVTNLSVDQIHDIYMGNIQNWSEVGGLDCVMKPYVRNRNSGSQEKFETMVMDGLTIADFPEMRIGTTMMSPYYQLEDDTAGIAFSPFYYYKVMVDSKKVRAVGVNGVEMTKENVMNGSYPYTSKVYTAVRSDIDKTSAAYRLFEFLSSETGQAIVDESGYVPLKDASSTGMQASSNEIFELIYDNHILMILSSDLPERLEIYNLEGKKVFESAVLSCDVQIPVGLRGMHVVYLSQGDGGVFAKKIVL